MSGWDDKVEGKSKEAVGAVTGNDKQKTEGKVQDTWGTVQNKAGDLKDQAEDDVNDANTDK